MNNLIFRLLKICWRRRRTHWPRINYFLIFSLSLTPSLQRPSYIHERIAVIISLSEDYRVLAESFLFRYWCISDAFKSDIHYKVNSKRLHVPYELIFVVIHCHFLPHFFVKLISREEQLYILQNWYVPFNCIYLFSMIIQFFFMLLSYYLMLVC
jgi:hypothetical protein